MVWKDGGKFLESCNGCVNEYSHVAKCFQLAQRSRRHFSLRAKKQRRNTGVRVPDLLSVVMLRGLKKYFLALQDRSGEVVLL